MACDTFDFHDWQMVDADAFGIFSPHVNAAPAQNIARLEDGRFIVVYRVNLPSDRHEARVIDYTGGSFSAGPITVVPGVSLLSISATAIALDANTFVLQYREFAIAGSIDGSDNITFGSSVNPWSAYPSGASRRAVCGTALSSSSYITFAKVDTVPGSDTGTDWEIRARVCSVSGTAITPGLEFAIVTGMGVTSEGSIMGVPYANSSGVWAVGLSVGKIGGVSTGSQTAYMAVGNSSGSFDLQVVAHNSDRLSHFTQLSWLNDNTLVAYYNEDHTGGGVPANILYMRAVSLSGATIASMGLPQIIAESTVDAGFTTGVYYYGVYQNGMAALSATKVLVHYGYDDYDTGKSCYRVAYLDVSGTTITEIAHCDINARSDYIIYSRPGKVLSGGYPVVAEYGPALVITCENEPGDSILLLGASTKGNTAYVTAWVDDTLVLNVLDIALATQIDSIFLGTATLAQVQAKTYTAYPFALSDSQVIVFGRMATDVGIAHIMYSNDSGSNFNIVESGWGFDYAGALVAFSGNNYFVARCNSYSTKVYSGSLAGTTLLSTLPFAGPVAPHGLRVSPWDDSMLIAVQKDGEAQTVLFSMTPYLAWEDITTNHPQTAVNAVVPL